MISEGVGVKMIGRRPAGHDPWSDCGLLSHQHVFCLSYSCSIIRHEGIMMIGIAKKHWSFSVSFFFFVFCSSMFFHISHNVCLNIIPLDAYTVL